MNSDKMNSDEVKPQSQPGFWLYDLDQLLRSPVLLELRNKAVGVPNPRPPGWKNDLIQFVKTRFARWLIWYTRPLLEFNSTVTRSVEEIVRALDQVSMNVVAVEQRLAESEKRIAFLKPPLLEHDANNARLNGEACGENYRTAYLIGLFGSGRHYINELVKGNIGERAKYFRDTIRLHPGPTPMIYSGHATIKHLSGYQVSPEATRRLFEAVSSRFADLIFIYRHPLDSLLTNWIWWRTYIRDNQMILGISAVYGNTDDLCADLDRNFEEFKAFADGDPGFFASLPLPRFLSFAEFLEETELYLQTATLSLRLEDFMIDPVSEFLKIAEVMSVDLDMTRLTVGPPKTKPFGYLTVQEKVPRFKSFIDALDAESRKRMERIGCVQGAEQKTI